MKRGMSNVFNKEGLSITLSEQRIGKLLLRNSNKTPSLVTSWGKLH